MEERRIDKILSFKLGENKRPDPPQVIDILFIICLLLFSFAVRYAFWPVISGDYNGFLAEWMWRIREEGRIYSLSREISNYTPAYMYFMVYLSYFDYPDLYMLKLLSIFFDYLGGAAMYFIIYRISGNRKRAVLGMAALLLAPSVVLNSASWAQCDMIYGSFILWAYYFLLKRNSKLTLVFVGIAFCFKMQALFFLPFLIILWEKDYVVKLRHFLFIPAMYLISILPSWIMGRDVKQLLSIYGMQAEYYPWGTMNYPNIYVLLGEALPELHYAEEVGQAGVFMTIILLGCLAYYFHDKKIRFNAELTGTLGLFTIAVTVYSLPHMHERYGFLIDLFAIVYGFTNGKRLPVTVLFLLISLASYMPFLIGRNTIPMEALAVGMLILILYLGRDLMRQMGQRKLEMAD